MKIAVVGAPGSGKSTVASYLYHSLLENGAEEPRIVTEYARKFIAERGSINSPCKQLHVSQTQYQLELDEFKQGAKHLVCDAGVHLGLPYMEMLADEVDDDYYNLCMNSYDEYQYIFYVPLQDTEAQAELSESDPLRIHNWEQSRIVDKRIRQIHDDRIKKELFNKNKHVDIPKDFSVRKSFIDLWVYNLLKSKDLRVTI